MGRTHERHRVPTRNKRPRRSSLNPMLAYSQGGASTPNVSAATVSPEDATGRSVTSAANKAMQVQQLQNIELNNRILQEKWEQERMATQRDKVIMGQGDIRDEHGNVITPPRPWFMDRLAQSQIRIRTEGDRTPSRRTNSGIQRTKRSRTGTHPATRKSTSTKSGKSSCAWTTGKRSARQMVRNRRRSITSRESRHVHRPMASHDLRR